MCGIVGIVGKSYVNQALYDALTVLQHRGQDAAGIATCDGDGRFFLHKDNGLVRDVFSEREMQRLVGDYGIGHVRYPTAGTSSAAEAQPLYVNSPYGIALAHNGNLTNTDELIRAIYASDLRHINTHSDSEALLNVFAHEIQRQQQLRPTPEVIFEYVYFARPDSTIDGINVYKARLRMGEKLAERILRDWPTHDIDVVIPIPDTSRSSAIELAARLGVKYREGFVKNRYIGRTFIMPGQKLRKKSVRQKLNAMTLEFRNKNVLLVDDSIVRGTTSEQIIQMARDAGAKKVYFASAAPPVRFPNVYGIDMPTHDELIAYRREEADVAAAIGADRVIYQTLPDLIDACAGSKHSLPEAFDCSVFNGCYITGDIDDAYLARLKHQHRDAKVSRKTPMDGAQGG